jgi:hypothetical protein
MTIKKLINLLKNKFHKFFNFKLINLNNIKIEDVNPLANIDDEDKLNSFTSYKIIFKTAQQTMTRILLW